LRLIFKNRFYWLGELATKQPLTYLGERLAAAKKDVEVIANCSRGTGFPQEETQNGVCVTRARSSSGNSTSLGCVAKAAESWEALLPSSGLAGRP